MPRASWSSASALRLGALGVAIAGLATAPACNGGGGTQPTPGPSATRPPTTRPTRSPVLTPIPATPTPTPEPTPRGPELRGRVRAEANWLSETGLARVTSMAAGEVLRSELRGAGIRVDGTYVPLPGLAGANFDTLMSQTLGGLGRRYGLAQAGTAKWRVLPVAGLVVAAFDLRSGALVRPTDGRDPWAVTGADGSFALPMPAGDPGALLVVARPATTEESTSLIGFGGTTMVAAGSGNFVLAQAGGTGLRLPGGGEPARLGLSAIVRPAGREIVIDEEARVLTAFLRQAARDAVRGSWQLVGETAALLQRVPAAERPALLSRAGDLLLAAADLDAARAGAAGASPGPAVNAFGAALAGLRSVATRAIEAQPSLLSGPAWPQPSPTPDPGATPAPDASGNPLPTPAPSFFPGFPQPPGPVDVLDLVVGRWVLTGEAGGPEAARAMAALGTAGRSDGQPFSLAPLAAAAGALEEALQAAATAERAALRALLDSAAGPAPTPTPIKLGSTPRPSPSVP